jgi:putative cell wall-binding protein
VVGGLSLATVVATAGPALALTSQTISFTGPASTALNAGPVAVSATATSGLAVAFTSATAGVCTVAGTSVTLVSVGTCTINANQSGNGTFSAATQVAQSFPVTIGSQTIAFTGPATSQLNASPVTVTATASSGLTVAFTSATSGVCTVAGTSVTLVAAGTCTINANQAGNGNWTAAPQVVQSFNVTLNAQTVTFAQPASVQLTAATDTIAATATSGLTVAFTSSTAGVCTVSGTTVTLVAVGTCTINADQAGNGSFAVAPTVARSFQVTGSTAQTITFANPGSTPQLTGTVTVTGTSTSTLTVAFTSTTTGVCTVSGTTVTLLTAGNCTIHADQAGNGTFAAATTVPQTFAVTLTAQTISFTGPATTVLSAGPVTVTATASSGLTPVFTSSTTGVCTVSGTTVTLLTIGTCTIDANQAGNVSYSAATQVVQSFTVTIGSQTIAFTGPGSTLLSAGTVALTATASSGLTVAFTSATAPVCTVTGTTVTLVALGTCTINANQAGTSNYTAATQVAQSFAVTAAVSSGGGAAPTVPATPVRLSGSDRFGTAIAASAVEFPTAGTAGAVVLARSDDYPDALVGAALAHAKNAPLLFANGGLLTAATQAEIQRVLPAGGTVYLLGGTTAIPASVATTLTGLGFVSVRYAGTDRFGTALAVADALNDPSTVLLATGINFPDALAAGPAAAHVNGVVLLTDGSSLTPAVTAYLAAHPGTVYAIGGPAVAADPSATPLSGADRYATAAAVASTLFTAPTNIGVASGTAFPDALSGGAFQAHFGGPIVLTDPNTFPASTSAYLTTAESTIVTTNIFGGDTALSVTVQTAVGTALGL